MSRCLPLASVVLALASGPTRAGDVATLSPSWTVADDPALLRWRVSDADADTVVIDRESDHGDDVWVLDAKTGAVRSRLVGWAGPFMGRPYFDRRTRLVAPGKLLVWRAADEVVLLAESGAELWSATLPVGYTLMALDRALGDAIVLGHPSDGLVVLELANGRQRWAAATRPAIDTPPIAAAGRIFAFELATALYALDAASGRELWRVPLPDDIYSHWEVRSVGDRLVLASRTLLVLDPSTGRELAKNPIPPPREPGFTAAAGGLFVRAGWTRSMEALDPSTGRRVWQRRDTLGDLVAGADGLYGCGRGDILYALDLATGAVRWSQGLPHCREPWPVERRGWRLAPTPDGDRLIVRGPHGIVAFAAGPAAVAPERATIVGVAHIDGRRHEGVRVRIGDSTARTDALGRFGLTVAARGVVHVALDRDEVARISPYPCPGDSDVTVELTGAGRYRADIAARAYDYECDRACRCD